jgi:phosphoglycolate phosphatase
LKPQVSLCVFDLDNTLFDWVGMWHSMFSALLGELHRLSGVPIDTLKTEFRAIHQRHRTSEYAFALEELPSLGAKHPGENLRAVYDEALHAYYKARKASLKAYPGVLEVLKFLSEKRVRLIGYTESMAFYSAQRIRELDIDLYLEVLYSPEDHKLPRNLNPADIRYYDEDYYKLRKTEHRHTPAGELKPNPRILRSILDDARTAPEHTAYVGDSEMKDIAMANEVGAYSVLAKYGQSFDQAGYDLLREVTHWSEADVQRERDVKKSFEESRARSEHIPNFVLQQSIGELLGLFDFVPAANL